MQPLKLVPVGDSLGIALPEAVLTRLGLGPGDSLYLSETEAGYLLTAEDPEFARQLGLARQIMAERHSVLYFWRDSAGHEIDLLFERDGKLQAIEIKSGATFVPD